ncbi:SDR family NAD(P)-dependent oxidoreductase, partial [Enterococcus sp. S181_ASV_20]|nr:SDR family NAD(P)-dependent oxidoreductase [Enterococcus sp. S181_ASV_20]
DLWEKILDTNLKSMFILTKLLLPELLENRGTVINMASIAGLVAGGGGIAYTTSKHAIVGFTKQLALDYATEGLHVNALAPGAIQTPMNQADFAGDGQMAKWVA